MTINYLDSKRISTSPESISKSDCLAYYNFEQTGSTLTNQATSANGYSEGVGSNADGTNTGVGGYTGATTGATGKVNNCWDFGRGSNTAGDYVSGINLNLNGAGSISVWINIVLADYGEIIGRASATNLVSYADGHIYYQGLSTSAGVLSSNTWHHVVGTKDSSNNCKIYVDNVLVKTGTGDAVTDSTVEYYIGARATSQNYHPDGKIDELSIWSRELTTSDISMLYNSGDGSTIDNTSGEQTKPTNVQDNSILIEKDTGERYWFSEALAPTYGGNDVTWTQTIGSSTSDTFYILKDTGNDLMDIKAAGNCGTWADPSIGYVTLGSTLSSSSWIVRFKLVFNTVTAESTGGKSFLTTFGVVDTATDWQDSENGFTFRFIADGGSTQTQFASATSGTISTTSMGWTPATGETIYVQIAYSSGTATANFYSDPEFLTGVGTANVTKSGTFSGIRYPQIALLQDAGGNGVMEIDMEDLKIYNAVTSVTPATWTNPKANVGQIAQLSGSNASNSYTAASEFYTISTDTWDSAFNISGGGRARAGSAGSTEHAYLMGGQDGSSYYSTIDKVAWADETNTTISRSTRAWGGAVANAVSVCVGQSYYSGSYQTGINEYTYGTMAETSQGNTSSSHAFGGSFGNSTYGFVLNGNTTGIERYTYSDKSKTASGFTASPTSTNPAGGHTGNSTTGISVNNTAGSGNARYDAYNISADTWTTNSATSTTPYEHGKATGSTKYDLFSTQTNTGTARQCEKYNYSSGALSSFTSVATNLDGSDQDSGASSTNTGVNS